MTRTQKVLEACGFEKQRKLRKTLYSREDEGEYRVIGRTEKIGGAYFWKKDEAILARVEAGSGPVSFFKKSVDNPHGRYYLAGTFSRRDFLLHSSEHLTAVRLADL